MVPALNKRLSIVLALAGGAVLLALPLLFDNPYHGHVLVMAAIFVVLALGLNLIFGYAGQLAFGYTAFFALGAYGATLLSLHAPTPFWVDILGGSVLAAAVAWLLGYPCLRLRGPFFALSTFAFAEIIRLIANNWISLTNGPMGLSIREFPTLEVPGLAPVQLRTEIQFYYLALIIAAFAVYVNVRLIGSRFGRAFIGIRQNQDLAASVGVDPFRYKMIAWVVAAALAGLAGGTLAQYLRIVDPLLFSLYYTFLVFSMVVIGGAGTILGPIVGGIAFTILPEVLRMAQSYRMIMFTSLLLLFILFLPKGLAGVVRWIVQRRRAPPAADAVETERP